MPAGFRMPDTTMSATTMLSNCWSQNAIDGENKNVLLAMSAVEQW